GRHRVRIPLAQLGAGTQKAPRGRDRGRIQSGGRRRAAQGKRTTVPVLAPAMNKSQALPPRRSCVAPRMNRAERRARYRLRVVARALMHGDPGRFLAHHADESPLALQLGGSEPATLAHAAGLAEEHGYDEVNINAGCPSTRVTGGRMGAILMREPERVADCVK